MQALQFGIFASEVWGLLLGADVIAQIHNPFKGSPSILWFHLLSWGSAAAFTAWLTAGSDQIWGPHVTAANISVCSDCSVSVIMACFHFACMPSRRCRPLWIRSFGSRQYLSPAPVSATKNYDPHPASPFVSPSHFPALPHVGIRPSIACVLASSPCARATGEGRSTATRACHLRVDQYASSRVLAGLGIRTAIVCAVVAILQRPLPRHAPLHQRAGVSGAG